MNFHLIACIALACLLTACGPVQKQSEKASDASSETAEVNISVNTEETAEDMPIEIDETPATPEAAPAGASRPAAYIGKWQTTALTIQLKAPFAEAREQLDLVHRGDFQTSIMRQKIFTTLSADGTFEIETINLEGKRVFRQAGTWHVTASTLKLKQQAPRKHTFSFEVEQAGADELRVSGLIDALGAGTYKDQYQATWSRR